MALNIREGILIETNGTYKLADMYLSIKDIGILAYLLVELVLVVIALIGNLADNLLEDILERHEALRCAILVDNNSNMYLLLLELLQQVVDHHVLGHKVGLAEQRLPLEIIALSNIWKQILDIEHTTHIVKIIAIDGDT